MHKYEFKCLVDPNEEQLNALGAEGWRLVSVVAEEVFPGESYSFTRPVAYLQRKAQPAPRIPSYTDTPWAIPAKEDK